MTDFETLVLAALLHDVGTLLGLPMPEVERVQAHPALANQLHRACNAATPGGKHKAELAHAPLVSIFSLLRRTGVPAPDPNAPRHFDFAPLGSTADEMKYLFPVNQPSQSYDAYVSKVRKEFKTLYDQFANADFNTRLNHLMAFLQRSTWCLPAHDDTVAFYDHARLTAAIAACLYHQSSNEPYVLVVGDLSGIQDYIFDIATVGAGGAAKRLRARSFSIGLISDMASHAVALKFQMPFANILMSSGGKFYVLLPQLADTDERLKAFRAQVDAWLYKQYNGEIGLNLAWLALGDRQLDASQATAEGFGTFVGRLNHQLAIEKLRRSQTVLQDTSGWRADQFLIEDLDFKGEGACVSCEKFPGTERDGLCKQCAQQSRLGSKLTRARAIAFARGKDSAADFIFLDEYSAYVLGADEVEKSRGDAYLVVQINMPKTSEIANRPAAFRYLANHVPLDADGSPLAFDGIAGKAETATPDNRLKGRKLLGYVKGDGDNLGLLLASGLLGEKEQANRDTAAHIVAFSRELDLFFAGWLEHALAHEHRDCYTIFSGGDDLFMLCPWNQAVKVATSVNEVFRKFACENPAVTFSVGVLYTKPRYPIARAAPDAEHELEKSKKPETKNAATVLGDTLGWQELAGASKQIDDLAKYDDEILRSSFLYRLIHYGEMYRFAKDKSNAAAARYKSHFAYTVARNLRDDSKTKNLRDWADALLKDLFDGKPNSIMDHLGLIATTVLFTRRTRRK